MNDINQTRLFEYVGTFKPIISLGCKNDAKARIATTKIKSGLHFRIIKEILDYLIRNQKNKIETVRPIFAEVKKYSYDLWAPNLNKFIYESIKSK